jgi:hypothetical protein
LNLHTALIAAVLQAYPPVALMPRDSPFQQCAKKALKGEFGKLKEWQVIGYKAGLKPGRTSNTTIWLTAYYKIEGSQGKNDCKGRPCSLRTAAANTIKQDSFVWTKYGLRQVRDRGAKSNDHVAKRKGAAHWVDYWYESPKYNQFGGSTITPCVIIR